MFLALLLCANLDFAFAQGTIRVSSHEFFQLTENAIVVDSLIMADSSALLLVQNKKTTQIRASHARFGKNCIIDGAGLNAHLESQVRDGADGTDAKNLMLYLTALEIEGELMINLPGGDGSNGKAGGEGAQVTVPRNRQEFTTNKARYSPTEPGRGGNGGRGGNLIISFPADFDEIIRQKIIVINHGGKKGQVGGPTTSQKVHDGFAGKAGTITYIPVKVDKD